MSKGVFVVGTDTEVGKTVITAGLVHVLRRQGINTCSFKAVQSGGTWQDGKLLEGDTLWVKKVCNINEDYNLMNPYALQPEVSPHLAARIEGKVIDRNRILDAYKTLSQKYDFMVAEGAGGLIVPIIDDKYLIYNLIQDLNLPVVVVTRAGLGAINHTILTLNYLEKLAIPVKGIIVNNFTGKIHEKDNIDYMQKLSGKKVIAVINHMDNLDQDPEFKQLKSEFEAKIKISDLM